ncbi:MAG: hypothetical protein ABH870_02950, partial [bacterium]
IPQIDVPLSLQEVSILGSNIKGLKHCFVESYQKITQIRKRLETALSYFPNGVFVRLGSRSAKDSHHAQHYGLRVDNAYAAVKMLTESSKRVLFDLLLACRNNYSPHIFVRQWMEIPAWAEFRCFMKNRKLVGISQYDCKNLGYCPEIDENAGRIRFAIEQFFEKFKEVSHLDDVVFDVFTIIHKEENDISIDVKLIELNPFFSKTDSCLFSWSCDNDFDGSFRYIRR